MFLKNQKILQKHRIYLTIPVIKDISPSESLTDSFNRRLELDKLCFVCSLARW